MAKNPEILILDHDPDARQTLRKALEGSGYAVSEARTVGEALERAGTVAPHLLITELRLPKLVGFQLIRDWRANPFLARIPIVVLTSLKEEKYERKARALGASEFLPKPLDTKALIQKIRRTLKDVDSIRVRVLDPTLRRATVQVAGRITALNELGCILESPIKAAPESDMIVHSALFEELGIRHVPLKRSASPSVLGDGGLYMGSVVFLGLPENLRHAIRKAVARW